MSFERRFFRLSDRALFGSAHLPRGLHAPARAAYRYICRCQDFGGARCAARACAGRVGRCAGRLRNRRTMNMKSAASATAAGIMPVRRDLRFDLPVER
ncbi:hypothetical protein M3691_37915, partial [Paenibacillus elgii]|nr:hypothetical protein [Paenibacillus elgii]